MEKITVAVLCSAGGSAFEQIASFFQQYIDFYLITDRLCGAEQKAQQLSIESYRIDFISNSNFSSCLLDKLKSIHADILLCFFSRLLTEPLLSNISCYNVHPSILPSYPGMGAEKKAFENCDEYIGASLHVIDSGVDTGHIVFQSKRRVYEKTLSAYYRAAFIEKVKVGMLLCEALILNGVDRFKRSYYYKPSHDFQEKKFKDKFEQFLLNMK